MRLEEATTDELVEELISRDYVRVITVDHHEGFAVTTESGVNESGAGQAVILIVE